MPWSEKYDIDPETGCHVWNRARQSRGYGAVWFDGKVHLAHRVAWFRAHGSWPSDGLVVDHVCNNKACVNPEHLREVPNHVNLRRAHPPPKNDADLQRRLYWREYGQRRRGTYGPLYSISGGD